jgi:hypothetical protein
VDLSVGSDGSSLGGSESAHGSGELDLGETEPLGSGLSVSPGFSGSSRSSSVSGGSSLLMVDHSCEVSSSSLEDVSPVMGSSQSGLSHLDGMSSAGSPVSEAMGHFVDVTVSSVNSSLGGMDGTDGSNVMDVGSSYGGMGGMSSFFGVSSVLLGMGVSSHGSVVGSDSSLEVHGESMHELLDVASVVVGLEVSESVVTSVGDESHVHLHKSSSGSLSLFESGSVVEERKITEVGVLLDDSNLLLVESVVSISGSDFA